MRKKWVFLILASIAALFILAACGGDDDGAGGGESNPGAITAVEAETRVLALLEAGGCDTPQPQSFRDTTAEGGKWKLKASIGLSSFKWTYDPVANTVVEADGKCASAK